MTRHCSHRVQHSPILNIPTWTGELLDQSLPGNGKIQGCRLLRIAGTHKTRLKEAKQKDRFGI
jgi:hypothetical protein